MGRISDWVNRQRHNKGYGIQSPSEFFFVTQVLKERLPYYAYTLLEDIADKGKCNKKHLKELFRITNHHNPVNCIAIGSATASCAMTIAKPTAEKYCITDYDINDELQGLLAFNNCKVIKGNAVKQLEQILKKLKEIGMLYIGNCNERAELLETALRYTNAKSFIVIDGIHSDKDVERWWKNVVEDPETIVTYDLYSYGILYFNKERYKQHYTLKR
jgi:hypothetical protein